MYRSFNYEPNLSKKSFSAEKYYDLGVIQYENYKRFSHRLLSNYIYDGIIDGCGLREEWFRTVDADIFISHSHKDLNDVIALSGWLKEEFGLTAFVDSCVWGCCYDLLREIDDKYCRNSDGKTYSYRLRNFSTRHVHAMLSTALTDMMNNCECILFYNTPNSVPIEHAISSAKKSGKVTVSPWIFYELSTSATLQLRVPDRLKGKVQIRENLIFQYVQSSIQIGYNVTKFINAMKCINDGTLTVYISAEADVGIDYFVLS